MTRAANPLTAVRVYPACCTSMYCGKSECGGCRNEPVLREFKAWQEFVAERTLTYRYTGFSTMRYHAAVQVTAVG